MLEDDYLDDFEPDHWIDDTPDDDYESEQWVEPFDEDAEWLDENPWHDEGWSLEEIEDLYLVDSNGEEL